MLPRPFRVMARAQELADTWTLALAPGDGDPLAIAPGQFTMLYAFGVGEVPISVSGDGSGQLVHTIRAVGPVTRALCATPVGAELGVRGPFGNTWPLDEAADAEVVVVAGGLGLAPLRPAIQRALRQREHGAVSVLYGSRTPDALLYRGELERLAATPGVDVAVTVDAADASWHGEVGVVAKLVAGARFDPASTVALVCGPEVMMRFAAVALVDRGVPADRIFVSLERDMRCGVGHCGHCQLGPTLICRDGPVYRWSDAEPLLRVREL